MCLGAYNLQDERHYPHHSELGQIEPVACIAWIMDEEVRIKVVAGNKEKADSELLRCRNQDKKDVFEGNIRAILLRPNESKLRDKRQNAQNREDTTYCLVRALFCDSHRVNSLQLTF